jgi:hypothetical protein
LLSRFDESRFFATIGAAVRDYRQRQTSKPHIAAM